MNTSEYPAWLRLVSIKGLGPGIIQKLLTKYSSPKNIFKAARDELEELTFIPKKVIENIIHFDSSLSRINH